MVFWSSRLQSITSPILIAIVNDAVIKGNGDEDVFCSGPFAADNLNITSNSGDVYYINSAVLVLSDVVVGSNDGGLLFLSSVVQVSVHGQLLRWCLLSVSVLAQC